MKQTHRLRRLEASDHLLSRQRRDDAARRGKRVGEKQVITVNAEQSSSQSQQHRWIAHLARQRYCAAQVGDRFMLPAYRDERLRSSLQSGGLILDPPPTPADREGVLRSAECLFPVAPGERNLGASLGQAELPQPAGPSGCSVRSLRYLCQHRLGASCLVSPGTVQQQVYFGELLDGVRVRGTSLSVLQGADGPDAHSGPFRQLLLGQTNVEPELLSRDPEMRCSAALCRRSVLAWRWFPLACTPAT